MLLDTLSNNWCKKTPKKRRKKEKKKKEKLLATKEEIVFCIQFYILQAVVLHSLYFFTRVTPKYQPDDILLCQGRRRKVQQQNLRDNVSMKTLNPSYPSSYPLHRVTTQYQCVCSKNFSVFVFSGDCSANTQTETVQSRGELTVIQKLEHSDGQFPSTLELSMVFWSKICVKIDYL